MERLEFDSEGKFVGIGASKVKAGRRSFGSQKYGNKDYNRSDENVDLKTSDSLQFLKEEKEVEDIFSRDYWSLLENGKQIEPLKFSNGKTQEDLVKEIASLIEQGEKIIFLHGACGTGKSAIALNLARVLGKASVVVPVKALQKQYEEDYLDKKYLLRGGEKLKLAVITGKDNHDSVIFPGKSCADPSLPENIKITEKNRGQVLEYYKDNPIIKNKDVDDVRKLKRLSIAPSNPYWSPILPASFDLSLFKGVPKKRYTGCDGREYMFYHRKRGCSYYDQFLAYFQADVILYNSAKYKSELSIGRKPETEIDIIDEADEFLDGLFQQEEINLTRLANSMKGVKSDYDKTEHDIDKIMKLINNEETNKRALGIDEDKVYHVRDTKILEILKILSSNEELESEIVLDEGSYANRVLEASKHFKDVFQELYLTYRKNDDDNLLIKLVSTNLKSAVDEMIGKSKALVFMSGTLHSDEVLKHIYGLENYKVVEAETINQGSIDIVRTGKEFDCKYANFASKRYNREDYLRALESVVDKAETPLLVHVNAFQDLPNENEKSDLSLELMSSEKLRKTQWEDRVGNAVSIFKQGLSDVLFTTKCARGVDFPGDTCKSMVFTKYPNPNISDTFWKILKETHPDYFWEFYRDKAWREFLQRIFRGLRSKEDHIRVLSPDLRVLESVRKLQLT
tara:strand:- start:298 stop:2340 length:2043 start_codon:yes stop_codon:yes gene_type:complete